MEPTEQARQHVLEIARGFDNAMLITHAPAGAFHARPMAIAEVSDGGDLWFVTRIDTPKIDELSRDNRMLVVMQGESQYVSLAGRAEVQRDPQRIEQLWHEAWRIWFKDKHDPELVLIHMQPSEAEYWDSSGLSGVRVALRAAASYVTGDPSYVQQQDEGTHGKLPL